MHFFKDYGSMNKERKKEYIFQESTFTIMKAQSSGKIIPLLWLFLFKLFHILIAHLNRGLW